MGKLFILMGKSASGKDTIYQKLFEEDDCNLKKIIPYTTRPKRNGEEDGKEYFFVSEDELDVMKSDNRVVECRDYDTIFGKWYYFTANDKQIDFEGQDIIMISTLEGFIQIKEYFGEDKVIPIYIDVDDYVRLKRSIEREKLQNNPSYNEVCRRFLADEEDFRNENLFKNGVRKKIPNDNLNDCLQAVKDLIKSAR